MRKRNNPSCAVRLDNTTRISELEYLRRQVHYFLPGLCPEPMLLTGNKPLDYCIYACVTLVHDPLELWSKNPSFYFKNILGRLVLIGTHFPVFFALFRLPYSGISQKKSVIQELRTRKNGLTKRFSRVGPIITHSRESSNSQRDPQDHAYP